MKAKKRKKTKDRTKIRKRKKGGKKIFLFLILFLALGGFLIFKYARPERSFLEERLFFGVTYQRLPKDLPRPLMVHVITIDLLAPGLKAYTSIGVPDLGIRAKTLSEFIKESGVKIAINGSFFQPHYVNNIFDYFPHSGDIVHPFGMTMYMGQIYSRPEPDYYALCISDELKFAITRDYCPDEMTNAIAGGRYLVKAGELNVEESVDDILNPRSAFGFNQKLGKIWLVAVDGRQVAYSEGITIFELANLLKDLGADEALELDGGGSTTLGVQGSIGPRILNSPIEAGIFGHERPIANHLGFYVESLE